MAQITKTVDKVEVNGSEVFIYTINASYSGLTIPNQEGEIIDFFPSKIKYILPPIGGQIESISEDPVDGGTQVTFHLGTVNSGTSLSFTVACHFGPGRVDDDSYTNDAKLVANGEVILQATAPTVNLKLDEKFKLTKFAEPSNIVNAGDEITFILSLTNKEEPGATIRNVVITDELPPQLIPVIEFTPIGYDVPYYGYKDPSANGITGSWDDNTLIFNLPEYCGARYDITFKAKVSENVTLGEFFYNMAEWTMDGEDRNDSSLDISVFDPDAKGFNLVKKGTRTTIVGAPIKYELINSNDGNIPLNNYELEDFIPAEVDITGFSLEGYSGLVNYNIYIALESNSSEYIPVFDDVQNGLCHYTDLSPFIPREDRVAKIKLLAENLLVNESWHSLVILGTTNDTAVMGGSYTNEAVATSGSITQTKSWQTVVNGASDLSAGKNFLPMEEAYYPLDEFKVILSGSTLNTICINPILADLMPTKLRYIEDSEYFLYFEDAIEITYDSRQPNFPIPIPNREVLPNYSGTENTLVRWSFSDFILPTHCRIEIIFKVLVVPNGPGSFVNKGYMGVHGNNLFAVYDEVIDTLDIDGDDLNDDRISCKEVSGIVLTSSEFSLKKFVKGQKDLEYSKSGYTVQGGNIDYQLQITNTQPMDLKDIEIIDILPYVGDTGVILNNQSRGSEFDVYSISLVTAKIINVVENTVYQNPDIIIEYSTSNDPKRFDELGNDIGSGNWNLTPPDDIITIRSVKITTGPEVILHPYDRLIIDFRAKAPVDTPVGKIAYNSYAVRANKLTSDGVEPLLPTEPNKVEVTIAQKKRGSIGDFVWFDSNQDGIFDEDELGANGVTVELYDDKGNLLKTTVTTNDFNGKAGYYLFTDLDDGVYQVKFIPPKDYLLTKQQSSEQNGSKPNQTTGFTEYITLSNEQQILDIDAGLIEKNKASIGDFVWEDLNENGNYDPEEPGVNGITIELYDDDENLLKTTVTGNDEQGNAGYYLFDNLAIGKYKVKFIPTDEYLLTHQNVTEKNGSRPDPSTGFTDEIILINNNPKTDVDAGLIKCKSPVINATNKCIHVGDSFDPMADVTATDFNGKDITDKIVVVSNNVDTSIAGIYTVTYEVTDRRGQTATKTIEVIVCQDSPRAQAITDIFESVALEQTALSHILNAEGKKIQKAKALGLSADGMMRINCSVKDMVNSVTKLEMILKSKLELFEDCVCSDDCCDDFNN